MTHLRLIVVLLAALVVCGCSSARSTTELSVVQPFDQVRYLGVWYEQVRNDHRFERGLEAVSATYSQGEEGKIVVTNRGWNQDQGRWSEATGYALPAGTAEVGHLRVTFFWPFFGDYRVVYLDADYQTAFVTGPDFSWFWILTRTRDLDEATIESLIHRAEAMGFARAAMLRVRHDRAPR